LEAHFGEKEHGALLKSIQAVVIGSPGFYKNKLLEYLKEESEKKKSQTLKFLVSKCLLANCTTGFLQSVPEIMKNTHI
jgi:stalled ribosome rescue protein Dom34